MIPDNVRELAYNHIKNYNYRDYNDYMLTVISSKVISFCNKEEAIKYINSLDNKEEYLKRLGLEVTDENFKSLQHDKILGKVLGLGSYYRLSMSNKKKHYKITKKELLNTHEEIGEIFGHYPPNIIEIKGKLLCYYHGFEDFMNWDSVDIRKYKKLLKKHRSKNEFVYL